jgi:hypothetical protein
MFLNINLSADEPALPSPTMTSTAMFTYFQQQFGFTQAEVYLDGQRGKEMGEKEKRKNIIN